MGRRPVTRILIHVVALLLILHVAILIASPPSEGAPLVEWIATPWAQIGNVLSVAVVLQFVAIVLIVLRFGGDRRTLRVGLLIAAAVVGTVLNSIVLGIVAEVTTATAMDASPFALSVFITGLAGMVFVVAASLAAALAEYALLPKPRSTVAT